MENKLEQLLNSLIEKGWKPFDVKWISEYFFESVPVGMYRLCWKKPDYDYNVYSKRELVSKESWLWQFVCENGMRPKRVWYEEHHWQRDNHTNWRWMVIESEPEYRLIESALKDESELEDFLLSNIKIEWNDL